MIKFPPANKERYHLRFEVDSAAEQGDPGKKATPQPQPHPQRTFVVPDCAMYSFKNSATKYIVTLIDGAMPDNPEAAADQVSDADDDDGGSRATRRAILLMHKQLDPHKVPMADWVLQDGASLPGGSASVVLIHRPTAELMHGYDIVHELKPHPRASHEICIRHTFLCPINSMQTQRQPESTEAAAQHRCVSCGEPAMDRCTLCVSVWFCSQYCADNARRFGLHEERDCVRAAATRLTEAAADAINKAIARGEQQQQQRRQADSPEPMKETES